MDELLDINDKLRELIKTLKRIEERLSRPEYPTPPLEKDMVRLMRRMVELYYMLIDYVVRGERLYSLVGGDDIKVWIIRMLYKHGEMNIVDLSKAIRRVRGRASRGVVAKKLSELERDGIVRLRLRGREKLYSLRI